MQNKKVRQGHQKSDFSWNQLNTNQLTNAEQEGSSHVKLTFEV